MLSIGGLKSISMGSGFTPTLAGLNLSGAGIITWTASGRTLRDSGTALACNNTLSSTIASGNNAFLIETQGARLKFSSAGTTNYFEASSGTFISTPGFLDAAHLQVRNNSGTGGVLMTIGTAGSAYLNVDTSGVLSLLSNAVLDLSDGSNFQVGYTDSSGTPGAATINKLSGRSAIAAGAASVVITNSLAVATSRIFISPHARDATGLLPLVTTRGAGSFTVTTTANCTAALTFDWWIVNGT